MTLPTGDVDPETLLYRRIPPSWLVEEDELGCQRVSSAAYRDPAMSIYLEDTLAAISRRPEEVLSEYEGYYLTQLRAGLVTEVGQRIERSPDEGVERDDDVRLAHGEVIGAKERKVDGVKIKEILRQAAEWVVRPSDACQDGV